jgi:hypothetical protein
MKFKKTMKMILPIIMGAMVITSCSNDDDGTMEPPVVGQGDSTTYQLGSVADPDISGTAKVIDNDDNSITVELSLQNTPAGGMHPAHIHFNTVVEGGDVAITLGTVDGSTGMSTITFSALNDGTPITYEELLDFDGYINVHLSADELGTLVAQGDIGQNELTAESKTYPLGSVAVADIEGTATFTKRANGEALAVIELANTPADGVHPGHIHMNTAIEGGGIAFTFNPVNGTTGVSKTNVAQLDDETGFGYDDVLGYDGYINIHLSAEELGTLVAQGDIGQNELTGEAKTYELGSVAVPTISGTATFEQRLNGEALATIMLEGTPDDGMHPAHIHANSAAEGGPVIFSFGLIDGTIGIIKKNVAMLDDGTLFGYEDVLDVDGYINVHLSMEEITTLVAQGDIGVNEEDAGTTAKNYDVTNIGTSTYVFNGEGETDSSNPNISLTRGETYTFTVSASGHPFFIKSVQGNTNANAFTSGVTNNGAQDGVVRFTVPTDAPDTLYYNCQFHSDMTGQFTITG